QLARFWPEFFPRRPPYSETLNAAVCRGRTPQQNKYSYSSTTADPNNTKNWMQSAIVVMAGLISMIVSGLFFLAIDAYLSAAASHGFPPAVLLPSSRPLCRPPTVFLTFLHCRVAIITFI